MDSNNTSLAINTSLSTTIEVAQSGSSSIQTARFWAYLFSDIFSLLCSFFTLHFLLTDRTLRQALNNHIRIVLLIIGLIYELTNIPWTLYSDYNHRPLIRSNLFYSFWTYIAQALYALQIELFAWATIERHILIFHDQWVSTSKKRFFVHYFPIGVISIYYIIYYGLVYFGAICVNSFDAFLTIGFNIPCAFDHTILGVWDLMFHQIVPLLIIVSFSIALIVRKILQKNRLRQGVNWRKHRKMIVQLLSISTIYVIFNSPWVLVAFAFQHGLPQNIVLAAFSYTSFLNPYVIFLFPFICCLALPELRKKFKINILCRRRPRRVTQGAFAGTREIVAGTNGSSRRNC
jgi:hypothetical protein